MPGGETPTTSIPKVAATPVAARPKPLANLRYQATRTAFHVLSYWRPIVSLGTSIVLIGSAFWFASSNRPTLEAYPIPFAVNLGICRYEQERSAALAAAQRYYQPSAPLDTDARDRAFRELEAAQRTQENARECEEREQTKSDLEAQWHSAIAAKNSAEVVGRSYWWGLAEFSALVLALGAAIWAAMEAKRGADIAAGQLRQAEKAANAERSRARSESWAADMRARAESRRFDLQLKAAQDTTAVTREVGQAQVRAYLSITKARVKVTELPNVDGQWFGGFEIEAEIKNSGQSPGRFLTFSVDGTYYTRLEVDGISCVDSTPIQDVAANIEMQASVFALTTMQFSDEALRKVEMISVRLTVAGEDVFGEPTSASTKFYLLWDDNEDRLVFKGMSADVNRSAAIESASS